METLEQVKDRLALETAEAYESSPYAFLSKDYFSRFSRDPDASRAEDDIVLDSNWRIVFTPDSEPLTEIMAEHLAGFLSQCMGITLPLDKRSSNEIGKETPGLIVLLDSG